MAVRELLGNETFAEAVLGNTGIGIGIDFLFVFYFLFLKFFFCFFFLSFLSFCR